MDGRIEHLRNHYRLIGSRAGAPALAARLDRVLPESGIGCYEAAIQEALADDESVYVLRRVHARMHMHLTEGVTDSALAKSWGTRVANSVLRALAAGDQSSENLIRFENQADYVAHFLVALLRGAQPGEWFYQSFAELTKLDRESAIKRALLDHADHLPAILGYLHRYRALDSLIAALDTETKRMLWSADPESPEELGRDFDLELGRPLFIMALQFVDRLATWARVPRDGEKLFRDYLETEPPAADWRDPRSLAVSFFEVVRFLFVRGYLIRSVRRPAKFRARLISALKDFEWLDRDWLEAAMTNLFTRNQETNQETAEVLPVRPLRGTATPRQRELLSNIAAAMSDAVDVRWSLLDSDTAALKLFASLVAASPAWADDTAGRVLLQNLIRASNAMKEARSPGEFLKRLQRGDVDGALDLLLGNQSEGTRVAPRQMANQSEPTRDGLRQIANQSERTRDALRQMANLGEPALALVEKLAGDVAATPVISEGVESECAGVALLLRSVLDARLHMLAHRQSYPRGGELPHVAMMLLLIGARVGGKRDVANGCFDEDLFLLAGIDQIPSGETLCSSWSETEPSAHSSFQNALLDITARQRLIEPATMHVFSAKLTDGKQAIVAGDETGKLWPLGRVINREEDIAIAIRDWQLAWKEATGIVPRVAAGDAAIISIVENDASLTLNKDPDIQTAHETGQQALRAALAALNRGQTGRADLDLTIAIVTCLMLRIFARWLQGFSASSIPFLIENFMRRRGQLQLQKDGLVVELERGPLDIVIEMAGYLSDLENVPWLPGGRVRFLIKGA